MRPSDLTRALILNKKGSTRAIFGDALFFFTLLLYFNLDKLQLSTEDLWPQRVQFLIVIWYAIHIREISHCSVSSTMQAYISMCIK